MALLPQNPEQQKKLLTGVAALALFFTYYQFVHTERTTEIDALETRLEALETTNAAAKALAMQGGTALENKLAGLEQHMFRIEELIPQREEVPDLLHAMTLRAQGAGVELTRMSPQLEEPGPYYSKQTYEIGVKGTVHRVGKYLADVGALPRIVTPIELTLRSGSGEIDRNGSPLLDASFRIVTYIVPDPPPPPTEPQTASTPSATARATPPPSGGTLGGGSHPRDDTHRGRDGKEDAKPIEDQKLIFEREVFVYPVANRRDPFEPLGKAGMGPMFAQLSLRMIIFSEAAEQSVAVLADGAQRSYRLRRGETLGNATLVEISPTRAVFLVEDYGNRRREVLDLRPAPASEGA